jgi:DNA polymerase/3'-5' exonuclease PolX
VFAPTIQALAALLLIAAVVLIVMALGVGRKKSSESNNKWSRRRRTSDQLDTIMRATFTRSRVMSPSEYAVFRIVENEVAATRKGYRVFAQTSLGEVLASADYNAFRCINYKRVDILVIDWEGYPAFAVEYQGSGHYQGDAAARDAVKKEALRKAGVGYIEVNVTDGEEQLRLRIREQLGLRAPEPPHRNDGPKIHPVKLVPQLH